jgi:ABC-type phosphate transport system substrate-binding protein
MNEPILSSACRLQGLRVLQVLVCFTLVLAGTVLPTAAADDVVVIVNAANPVSTLSEKEVSDLFLKKAGAWSDGSRAVPVDLGEGADARASFSRWIHRKNTAAVKSYWQNMIFSGRGVPPPEKTNPAAVVTFVRAERGAIGYVPRDTPLGNGVKVLNVVAR